MIKRIKYALLAAVIAQLPLNAALSDNIKALVHKSTPPSVEKIYRDTMYEPIWITPSGLTPLGKDLLSQIKEDKTVARDLKFYKLYRKIKQSIHKKKFTAQLDIEMTKLYMAYSRYRVLGNIDWQRFDKSLAALGKRYNYTVAWEHKKPSFNPEKTLELAKLNGSFGDSLSKYDPTRFKYHQLENYLEKYIAIWNRGGWKSVSLHKNLNIGSVDAAIPLIRKRLQLVGDLQNCSSDIESTTYDACMGKAVKRFKLRHGLKPSTLIDKGMRSELKKPVTYYIRKIRLNLDRIKWSNRKESRIRIELNIPAFRLYVYDGKGLVTTMRVVTGKKNHPTPVFSDVMTSIVVNPYWRIPQSIVRKEMLKRLIKDPKHYERQHKYLYKGWGAGSEKIDPKSVNWKKYLGNNKNIPYHFMQDPSSHNALGKIKFLFPNKYSVYIHDTPSKRLFFKQKRAFSHGCMRIQKPRELLEALALYNSNIHVEKVMKLLGTNKNTSFGLRRRVPIDITYLTAFVDDYGNLHFRDDIYGYDALQLKQHLLSTPKEGLKKRAKDGKKKKTPGSSKHKAKESSKHQVEGSSKHKAQKRKADKKELPKKKKSDYQVIEIGY